MSTAAPSKSKGSPSTRAAILAIHIVGGFLNNQTIRFDEDLNVIVGGTGTGKSTILELIRFVLGMKPARGTEKKHAELVKSLGSGQVTLEVQTKHGLGYKISRTPGAPKAWVTDMDDNVLDIPMSEEFFRVEFYAQNELYRTAQDPELLLAMLDKFTDGAAARATAAILDLEAKLDVRESELRRLAREIELGAERAEGLESAVAALKGLQEVGGSNAEAVRAALEARALRARERAVFEAAGADHAELVWETEAFGRSLSKRLGTELDGDASVGANREVLSNYAGDRAEALEAVRAGLEMVRAGLAKEEAGRAKRRQALDAAQAVQEARFAELIVHVEEEKGRAAERTRLEARVVELVGLRKQVDALRAEEAARFAEWVTLVRELVELRHGRSMARKAGYLKIEEMLGGKVSATLLEHSERKAYEELYWKVIHEGGLRAEDVTKKLVSSLPPSELVEIARAGDVQRVVDVGASKADLKRVERVLEVIRKSERIFELERMECPDRASLSLRKSDDGVAVTGEQSEGEGAICVLSLICLHSTDPLLSDQPEDQIDGAYVYHLFLPALRAAKSMRQQIFVTHHPSIPVLAPASQVIAMKAEKKRGQVAEAGPAPALSKTVERDLDGGSEAFLGRGKAYGYALRSEA